MKKAVFRCALTNNSQSAVCYQQKNIVINNLLTLIKNSEIFFLIEKLIALICCQKKIGLLLT